MGKRKREAARNKAIAAAARRQDGPNEKDNGDGNGTANGVNGSAGNNGSNEESSPPPPPPPPRSVIATLIHMSLVWFVMFGMFAGYKEVRKMIADGTFASWGAKGAGTTTSTSTSASDGGSVVREYYESANGLRIPKALLGPSNAYPNVLNITDEDRAAFHPVVKFPMIWVEEDEDDGNEAKKSKRKVPNIRLLDHTQSSAKDELCSDEERDARRLGKTSHEGEHLTGYAVGRYDENRLNLYDSAMFDDGSHQIDGFSGARTVHIGIDLDGPLGTKVHAFTSGKIYKVGYNPDLGDYGNVIVVEHDLNGGKGHKRSEPRRIYALYGHLDDNSIKGKKEGQKVKKGQVLGRTGDIHENGGWRISHVHFQLSLSPPETHDMPGVVSLQDRPRALLEYPDPRLVLGDLY